MEIERKYLISELPKDLDRFPYHVIEQAYLCTEPVVRVRREDDSFYLTCKGRGFIKREEINLPLSEEAYKSLLGKAEGYIVRKKRYLIPIREPRFAGGFVPPEGLFLTIELDIFDEPFSPLVVAEVEFPDDDTAKAYVMEEWFKEDVSTEARYHNSFMSANGPSALPLNGI